ncbi:MAG: pseudouridine synthase [bacterium]|jgi:23S rRNA pseudouridine2605 synthase
MVERLQKILAAAGYGSRRSCEGIIQRGRVSVNGQAVTELGTKADPDQDAIAVDGRLIQSQSKTYLLLYKPVGFTTTRSDPHAKHIVMELLPDVKESVYPVGRLDVDTDGLLLMTNDGELAHRLTHPRYNVFKIYRAAVEGIVKPETVGQLRNGVNLEDGITSPAEVKVLASKINQNESIVELTIHEGRKRQVKRMLMAVGHAVKSLRRVGFAELTLGKLMPGQFRYLTPQEVERLRQLCGLSSS